MKKIISLLMAVSVICSSLICANAKEMDIYVCNHKLVRDIVDINGFDMLPIGDIAWELGLDYLKHDNEIRLGDWERNPNNKTSYHFTIGSASVYDSDGRWYGLDIVPQYINGKLMIPAKFLQDIGYSYTWDSVTNTLFLGSDYTYNWLINTAEYKAAKSGANKPQPSYSKYPGTPFRTFTDAVGKSAWAVDGHVYRYGSTSLDTVYNYIAILKNDGMTYDGTQQSGSTVLIRFWSGNYLLLIAYDENTGDVNISAS